MQVIVRELPTELILHTVFVSENRDNPQNVFLFRCYHCGSSIAKVKGNITRITAGSMPMTSNSVINQCYKCGENYTFHLQKGYWFDPIKLTISSELKREKSSFFCVICRTKLLEYDDEKICYLARTDFMVQAPLDFNCFNSLCKKKYSLNEVVSL